MKSKLILASQSPRRRELMMRIPVDYEVIVQEVEEIIDFDKVPEENVMSLAEQKATAVAEMYPERWVIGCDTIVVSDGNILGKPKSEIDAFNMLNQLSGNKHRVITGVHLVNKNEKEAYSFYEETLVYFKEMSKEEISYYIQTEEPMDKAGAYGIQGYASLFIEKIHGDYYNVMGLPVHKLYQKLKELELVKLPIEK